MNSEFMSLQMIFSAKNFVALHATEGLFSMNFLMDAQSMLSCETLATIRAPEWFVGRLTSCLFYLIRGAIDFTFDTSLFIL